MIERITIASDELVVEIAPLGADGFEAVRLASPALQRGESAGVGVESRHMRRHRERKGQRAAAGKEIGDMTRAIERAGDEPSEDLVCRLRRLQKTAGRRRNIR